MRKYENATHGMPRTTPLAIRGLGDPQLAGQATELLAITELRPWSRNARTHSKKQIRQIAESIKCYGFNSPILIDGENSIIAGHARFEAAKVLNLKNVPCLRLDHMSLKEKRAYILADNKLALNAGWDEELLAREVQDLIAIDPEFSIDAIGFSIAEVDLLVEGLSPTEAGDPRDDQLPEIADIGFDISEGDIWMLGPHKLACGDSLVPEVVANLMDGEQAEMVFTDWPYNVPIAGHVSGLGSVKHREFAMASGEMSRPEFISFLRKAITNLLTYSADGSIHFLCMDWRHMGELQEAANGLYSELKNLIIWVKDNGGMGTFYRSRHELIFAFKKGEAQHINSFDLGQHGRYRTNVWQYKGVNTRKAGRMEELAMHPTVKPVAMIADAIKDVSHRKGIVLDLFGGSGSTLIAAHKTGRRARICELDGRYCALTIRRWEIFAKDEAEQIACGLPSEHPARLPLATSLSHPLQTPQTLVQP